MSQEANKHTKVDVLVIGAGPSGTVAAAILKNNGIDVRIIEKEVFPRFVIGESLLPHCMENLKEAGLLEAIEQKNFQQKFGAKFVRNEQIADFDFSNQFTEGWNYTWQVKRAEFDLALANEVQKKGVPIDFKTMVTAVNIRENGSSETTVLHADGGVGTIEAKFIVDASGYGRVLPRLLDLDIPSDFPARTAFFTHLKDKKRPTGVDGDRITIITYSNEVWLWVIPFSDGTSSVGVVGRSELIEKYEGSLASQYISWLQDVPCLEGRFEEENILFEPKKIAGYSSSVKKLYGKGFALTGNSTEFLDPVFSSGVTLATESAATAAKLIAREMKGEQVDWEEEYAAHLRRGVDVFRTFVSTWYDGSLQKIIYTNESNHEMKRQICSVLAGYVWDQSNPFVKQHERAVKALANVLK